MSMKLTKVTALTISHCFAITIGFAAGIYALPLILAPEAPDNIAVAIASKERQFTGNFSRDRLDSDAFHWGEGELSVGNQRISLLGSLAPGPDYKLYLSPEFVETEAAFNQLKSSMALVGSVKTFENFLLDVPSNIDITHYTTVVIWCETFGQFITTATYQ